VSANDIFSTVYVNYVTGYPISAATGHREHSDEIGYVGWDCQATGGIAGQSAFDNALVAGDTAQSRSVSYAGKDCVGSYAARRELGGKLADVRFESGFGG
jgi:hypothetical protein